MLNKIKQNSLQKQIAKNVALRDMSQINAKVKTIGFLVDEALYPSIDVFYSLAKKLNLLVKDVSVLSFVEPKKKASVLKNNQVCSKNFNWNGTIKNDDAIHFLNKKIDLLVGGYSKDNAYMNLMIAKSKAKFKVGFTALDECLFDLLIAVPNTDLEAFIKELKKYLVILNKL